MNIVRELTPAERMRCRDRAVRITRDALDELTLCMPLDCEWGDPITPELVQFIVDAAGRTADDRAIALNHGYSVGDKVRCRDGLGTIRAISPPRYATGQCNFLIEMEKKREHLGSEFWVEGTWNFERAST